MVLLMAGIRRRKWEALAFVILVAIHFEIRGAFFSTLLQRSPTFELSTNGIEFGTSAMSLLPPDVKVKNARRLWMKTYDQGWSGSVSLLKVAGIDPHEITEIVEAFRAESIRSGRLIEDWDSRTADSFSQFAASLVGEGEFPPGWWKSFADYTSCRALGWTSGSRRSPTVIRVLAIDSENQCLGLLSVFDR